MKLFLITLLLLFTLTGAKQAPSKIINGQVVAASDHRGIPAVQIRVAAKSIHTTSDVDGHFQLQAEIGDIVTFDALGYQKKSLKIESKTILRVILEESETLLDEIAFVETDAASSKYMEVGSARSVAAKRSSDAVGREAMAVATADRGIVSDRSRPLQNPSPQAGLLTAGEWNDLENWSFWTKLTNNKEYAKYAAYWTIYTGRKLAFQVVDQNGKGLLNIPVKLMAQGKVQFETLTDRYGMAHLFVDPFENDKSLALADFSVDINNGEEIRKALRVNQATVRIQIKKAKAFKKQIDIAYVVDATGSMGDEMEYLKVELLDVLKRIQRQRPNYSIHTGTVFYRDLDDEYVTRKSAFTKDAAQTLAFIQAQQADGGGDFPEAVDKAIQTALSELQWDSQAATKLLFLLLDAPPHHDAAVIENLKVSLRLAAQKGIKVIPIVASGIDKETEFLMRYMAQITNGTYVFITNDSGIGNAHLEPTVGKYQVEKLNALLERLVLKYVAE